MLNLLQSRFLFRMGDAQDAEQATRIAMAVYSTMIRDDPDSRARLRVTPEQPLNFPNYYCLASWIAQRHPRPQLHRPDLPAARHRRRLGRAPPRRTGRARRPLPRAARVATLDTHSATANAPGNGSEPAHRDPEAGTSTTSTPNGTQPAAADADHDGQDAPAREDTRDAAARKREVQVDYEPPPRATEPRRQPRPPRSSDAEYPDHAPGEHDAPAPDSLRELAFLDRINEIGPADQLDGAAKLPRLYDEDYAILALLDRVGLAPRTHDRPRRAARTRAPQPSSTG